MVVLQRAHKAGDHGSDDGRDSDPGHDHALSDGAGDAIGRAAADDPHEQKAQPDRAQPLADHEKPQGGRGQPVDSSPRPYPPGGPGGGTSVLWQPFLLSVQFGSGPGMSSGKGRPKPAPGCRRDDHQAQDPQCTVIAASASQCPPHRPPATDQRPRGRHARRDQNQCGASQPAQHRRVRDRDRDRSIALAWPAGGGEHRQERGQQGGVPAKGGHPGAEAEFLSSIGSAEVLPVESGSHTDS